MKFTKWRHWALGFGLLSANLSAASKASFMVRHFTDKYNLLTVSVPDNSPTMPLSLVAVLDVSGSMDTSASPNLESTEALFSRLDLLKHGMNTAIELMRPTDALSIITFSGDVKLVFNSTLMDAKGKKAAHAAVNAIRADGLTNLWGGIQLGVEKAKESLLAFPNFNANVIVLTDGEPNTNNPIRGFQGAVSGIMPPVKDPRALPISVHVIGIGNALSEATTELLAKDIALPGNGGFSFISDGTMVGTVFIHLVSNLLNVAMNNCRFNDKFVGQVLVGQSRDILVDKSFGVTTDADVEQIDRDRLAFISILSSITKPSERLGVIKMINRYIETSRDERFIDDLRHDDKNMGQVEKALDNWNTWGVSHIHSILSAHQRQWKMNFFDRAMTIYGGSQLEELVNAGEAIFKDENRLPPPRPSILPQGANRATYVAPQVSMQNMISKDTGCFSGDSLVAMENGVKSMKDLAPGDVVKGGAIIETIVKYHGDFLVRKIGSGAATSWHPFFYQNAPRQWLFPANVEEATQKETEVYNLILSKDHTIEMGDAVFVTLGHGFEEEGVAHTYFGDREKVIRDYADHAQNGYLEVFEYEEVRDPITGLITSYNLTKFSGKQ